MLPLECRYLNKSALTTLAGPLTPPVKHFQLKRKPKSATLRAELLQKCKCGRGGGGPLQGGGSPATRPATARHGPPANGSACLLQLLFSDFL